MRTKILLLTAALSLANLATCMAQVYSQNIVGYINKTVPANSIQLLASQLKTGTNGLDEILSGAADGDFVYRFNGTGYDVFQFIDGFGWDPTASFLPGDAFFYKHGAGSPVTLTFTGEVLTGSQTNTLSNAGAGNNIKGSKIPLAGDVELNLGLSGGDNDKIFQFVGGTWSPVRQYILGFGWDPTVTVSAGEGFLYQVAPGNPSVSWVKNFSPQ